MTVEKRCDLTEVINYFNDDGSAAHLACAHCIREAGLEGSDEPDIGPVITARYEGTCFACFNDIQLDEEIQAVDGEWVHKECVGKGWRP